MAPSGTPTPPTKPPPTGNWTHPTGERLEDRWIDFARPPAGPAATPATPSEAAVASLARPALVQPEPAPGAVSPERDYPAFINLDDPIYGLDDDDEVA